MEIFRDYSMKKREPICGQFMNLLNGSDGFIINMMARIIAKVACWGFELMEQKDLQFYLTWLKDQLTIAVRLPELKYTIKEVFTKISLDSF